MNRQQRRLQAREATRRRDFETRYAREIQNRQQKIDDRVIESYMVCIALALTNLYGWKGRGIGRVISEFNRLICSIDGVGVTFNTLESELYRRTGVKFQWAEDIATVDLK